MGHGFRVVTPEGIRHHDEMIRDIGPRKTKERMRTARKKFFLAGIHRRPLGSRPPLSSDARDRGRIARNGRTRDTGEPHGRGVGSGPFVPPQVKA